MDGDLFVDGHGQDQEGSEQHQSEALVRVEVVRPLRRRGPAQQLVQGVAHSTRKKHATHITVETETTDI